MKPATTATRAVGRARAAPPPAPPMSMLDDYLHPEPIRSPADAVMARLAVLAICCLVGGLLWAGALWLIFR